MVTNCSNELGRRAAARLGVALDVPVTAEAAGAYKPRSEPYRTALDQLVMAPDRALFVPGSRFDLAGARALRMPVCGTTASIWRGRLASAECGARHPDPTDRRHMTARGAERPAARTPRLVPPLADRRWSHHCQIPGPMGRARHEHLRPRIGARGGTRRAVAAGARRRRGRDRAGRAGGHCAPSAPRRAVGTARGLAGRPRRHPDRAGPGPARAPDAMRPRPDADFER